MHGINVTHEHNISISGMSDESNMFSSAAALMTELQQREDWKCAFENLPTSPRRIYDICCIVQVLLSFTSGFQCFDGLKKDGTEYKFLVWSNFSGEKNISYNDVDR